MSEAADAERLAALTDVVDRWLDVQERENPAVLSVAREVDGPRSWFVRVRGEDKDVFTIRYHLGQRTLRYETHFMPGPEENHGLLYEHLLRRNAKLYGASFSIGEEDAVYLGGQLANDQIDGDELDRVLGSLYAWVEQFFRPAIKIGFESRFRSEAAD